jgi:peptidoglycan/xylan/chitin deacetylase (PgdA/CDA1 family)
MRQTGVRMAAAGLVGSGAAAAARRRRRRAGDFRVFVLEYHAVSDEYGSTDGTVSTRCFRQHLRYLRRHYRVASLADAAAALSEPGALREDLAVVTFDDGYASNHESAWPILRAEGATATVFVTTGFLDGAELWFDLARRCLETARGRRIQLPASISAVLGNGRRGIEPAMQRLKRLAPPTRTALLAALRASAPPVRPPASPLSWAQARELHAAGIEIGCHTVSHPILSTLARAEQETEIVAARDRIAAELGSAPTSFAYPNGDAGDFDATTIELVRAAGFQVACTTRRGANRPGCDRYQLARLGVGDEPAFVLAARLAGAFDEGVRARMPRAMVQPLTAVAGGDA